MKFPHIGKMYYDELKRRGCYPDFSLKGFLGEKEEKEMTDEEFATKLDEIRIKYRIWKHMVSK